MNSLDTTERAEIALARSAAYGFLAAAFRYPTVESCVTLGEAGRWEGWPSILARYDNRTAEAIEQTRGRSLDGDLLEELQETYCTLFGHTARGACPLYEFEFGEGEIFQKSAQLSDVHGFYEAFGLELAGANPERGDHLSTEFEFMSSAAAREAYAIQVGDDEGLEIVRNAETRFLEDHLGRWLPSFSHRVTESDPDGFFGDLGKCAGALIDAECRHFGVQCGSQLMELRTTDRDNESVQTCAIEDCATVCPLNPQSAEPVGPPAEAKI